ncbi:MAG: hypothetical protein IPL78_30570 [Chloroflexi bacterium]|nr:hypothetical protein [Chloroflexota bacterium]
MDENQTWYRYHHLFAEALQEQPLPPALGLACPVVPPGFAWLEQHDHPAEAIQHALAAADYSRAAYLIDSAADKAIRRGEIRDDSPLAPGVTCGENGARSCRFMYLRWLDLALSEST